MAGYSSASLAIGVLFSDCITKDTPPPFTPPNTTFGYTPRTSTDLAKLAKLRSRLRRFGELSKTLKKLFAPGLEKALVFLDGKQLGATSNAVERGNRRYRKMQKTVYRVRTHRAIEVRLALDLLREQQARGRAETTQTLHEARAA